jgi:hemoglobin-like flavoprotein
MRRVTYWASLPLVPGPMSRHVGYGVRAADYQTAGEALVASLAAVLGDAFDPEARQARVLAYNLMAETMLDGAASARPVG